jgi:hypothetical protein
MATSFLGTSRWQPPDRRRVQPPDAENRMSGAVEGSRGKIPVAHPIMKEILRTALDRRWPGKPAISILNRARASRMPKCQLRSFRGRSEEGFKPGRLDLPRNDTDFDSGEAHALQDLLQIELREAEPYIRIEFAGLFVAVAC